MTDRTAYFKEYRSQPGYKEKQRVFQQKWRDDHPKESVAMSRRNRVKHREAFNKQATKKRKQERVELADPYLKFMIRKQSLFILGKDDIPTDFIECKRLMILTNRKLKTAI